MIQEKIKFHPTAIKRNKISAPVRFLYDNGLIYGKTLDYGCGRGFDTEALQITGYDPNSLKYSTLPKDKFDTKAVDFMFESAKLD